jgi:hypothetical protein
MNDRRSRRGVRGVVAGAVALTVLGGAAAANVGSAPGSVSHLSKWSHGEWTLQKRNTKVEVNLGFDDPAGQNPVKVGEVRVTQSWCDRSAPTKVLVERQLASSTGAPFSINDPRKNTAAFLNVSTLTGTETRTPAGTGPDCGAPTGAPAVKNTSVTAITAINMRRAPGSTALEYDRPEETGSFYYRDAVGSGQLSLIEPDGYYALGGHRSTGSWFWEGFWEDATGVEIVPGA